jgi:hypothetical protein
VTPVRYHEAAEEELLHEIGYLELRANGLGDGSLQRFGGLRSSSHSSQNRLRRFDRASGSAYSGSCDRPAGGIHGRKSFPGRRVDDPPRS